MNLPLLYAVLPLGWLLFILAVRFAYRLHKMSIAEFVIIWGGLYGKPQIYVWCVTYLLSSLGSLITFYLYVVFTADDEAFPTFVFGALNISYIVWICVVESQNIAVVLTCLIVNCMLYLMLFVYTVAEFHMDDTRVSNEALIFITHFCNAVAVVHVAVLDLGVWFGTWETLTGVEVPDARDI